MTDSTKIPRDTLRRLANDDYRREILPDELRGLEYLYEHRQNPLAAWHAFRLCHKYKLPFPAWALSYLDECAEKLARVKLKVRVNKNTLKKVKTAGPEVAKALGFTRPGKLNLYDQFKQELAEFETFLDIENHLTERGGAHGVLTVLQEHYAEKNGVEPKAIGDRYRKWRRLLRDKQRVSSAPMTS